MWRRGKRELWILLELVLYILSLMRQLETSVQRQGCALPGFGHPPETQTAKAMEKLLRRKIGGCLGNGSKSLI